jgi:hypothetical protein
MASAKFSAFEFASEEFNSDLARLVDVFTKGLLKIISEECVRNGDGGENSENGSNKSSPFSSPKGKAPRKKAAAAPKRGRPSKDETDVVIETVTDMRSVSDELSDRIEVVRNSSSPAESIPVTLDDLLTQQTQSPIPPEEVVEEQPVKKGKAKAAKEPKEPKAPKEKVVKEKVAKEPKAPKEKVVKEKVVKEPKEKKEKVAKEPKEKKEKVAKEPKAPKEPKAKKGKKGDTSPATEPEEIAKQSTETVTHDDDDNDDLDAEIVNSQTVTVESFDKTDALVASLHTAVSELSEEYDYASVVGAIDGIINILEEVVSSTQNSQEDEIVIDQDESQEVDKDDMSQPPDDDDSDGDIEEDEDDYDGNDL